LSSSLLFFQANLRRKKAIINLQNPTSISPKDKTLSSLKAYNFCIEIAASPIILWLLFTSRAFLRVS
jgi:hypothetical protein